MDAGLSSWHPFDAIRTESHSASLTPNLWRHMRPFFIARVVALLLIPGSLQAQSSADSAGFVIRHGKDTVATERFTRTETQLVGTLNLTGPKATSEHYSAVVAPDATLPMIEVVVREGMDTGSTKPKVLQRARVIFKEDSAAVDEVGPAGLVTRVFGTEDGALPYLNLSFALLEQAVRRARVANRGTQVPFFNLGGGQTLVARLTPLQGDSLRMDIGDTRIHLRFDREGRLVQGRIPVQNLVADRQ